MQENKVEVNTIRKDGTTYDMQRTNTLIFSNLSKTGHEYFLPDVKRQNSKWIKYPAMFNTAKSMVDLTNLYNNYKPTGLLDAHRKGAKSTIIALKTAFKKERDINSARKKPPGTTSGKLNSLAKWWFKHTGKDKS